MVNSGQLAESVPTDLVHKAVARTALVSAVSMLADVAGGGSYGTHGDPEKRSAEQRIPDRTS